MLGGQAVGRVLGLAAVGRTQVGARAGREDSLGIRVLGKWVGLSSVLAQG